MKFLKSITAALGFVLFLSLFLNGLQLDSNLAEAKSSKDQKMIRELMFERFTVRDYDPKGTVKKEDLDLILEAGLLAPSQDFRNGWRVLVLGQSEKSMKIRKNIWSKHAAYGGHCDENGKPFIQVLNPLIASPVSLFFIGKDNTVLPGDEKKSIDSGIERKKIITRDAMIAATAMMLQAEQLGYDTSFLGNLNYGPELKRELFPGKELDEYRDSFRIVQLGIGKAGPVRDLDELYSEENMKKAVKVNFECENPKGAIPSPDFKMVDLKAKHPVITQFSNIGNQQRRVREELVTYF